jgi:hypothetical protein
LPTAEKLERALSVRQPYVELILRGKKRQEYRSRPTNIRGRVYLYAGLKPGDYAWAAKKYRVRCSSDSLPVGRIVGSVELVGCKTRGDGEYAWLLPKPRRYRTPLTPRNQPQPSFWKPRF